MRLSFSSVCIPVIAGLIALPAAAQTRRTPATETIAIRVHEGTRLAFDLSPDGRRIVFDLLGQLWEIPAEGGEARALTDAVRDTSEDLDPSYSPAGDAIVFRGERHGRTGLWLLERGGMVRQLTQLDDPEGFDGEPGWAPDGRRVVFARLLPADSASPRPHTGIMWLDPASEGVGEIPVAGEAGPSLRSPAWSPDGQRLALVAAPAGSARGGRLWLSHADGSGLVPVTPSETRALAPAFSPDGRRVAYLAPDSAGRTQVWVAGVDTTAGAPRRLTSQGDVSPTRVRWSGDGQRLLYSADGRLWMIDAAGGAPVEVPFTVSLTITRARRALPPPHFPEPGVRQSVRAFMGMAISPDAKRVALLALGQLWVMAPGGTARAVARVPLSARDPAWSPDGAAVAWSAGPAGEEDVYATRIAGGATHRVTALGGSERFPAYSPDGRHLMVVHHPTEDSMIVRVLDASAAEVADTARGMSFGAENGADVRWTPDSQGLLLVEGGYGQGPTRGVIHRLDGGERTIERMPDSPLFIEWRPGGIVFVRHARLWHAPFDSTGLLAAPEPMGESPAHYLSVADDGTVLFVSEGGLRLRAPDGRERRLGWPVRYTPPVASPLLIRNARIIDGTGAPATPPRDVLVQGGRISRIGPAGALPAGGVKVFEAGGRFMLPGLMDLHAHLYRPALLPGFSYFGITTVRDQGSPIGPLVSYADDIAAGRLDGPRVDYGGIQFYSDWAFDLEDGEGVEPEADPGHAARAVALARAFGSPHIKTRTFRRWDINARFIADAHRLGMRVTGHCSHLLPLVAAGMDAKEHAGFCEPRSDGLIYDDLVQLYRAAGISVIPTIVYSDFAVRLNRQPDLLQADSELMPFVPPQGNFGWMLGLDSVRRETFAGYARDARAATTRLARAGVNIATGTDIWQIPTGVHLELEELVGTGMTPLQAIHAATGAAARVLGAEATLGTIAPGRIADLVILDGDPLADIRNTRRIRAVVQAGRMVDREALVERFRQDAAGSPRP